MADLPRTWVRGAVGDKKHTTQVPVVAETRSQGDTTEVKGAAEGELQLGGINLVPAEPNSCTSARDTTTLPVGATSVRLRIITWQLPA